MSALNELNQAEILEEEQFALIHPTILRPGHPKLAKYQFALDQPSPAQIFMGDSGSLGLGGALAALAILSQTEILLLLVGGLYAKGSSKLFAAAFQ